MKRLSNRLLLLSFFFAALMVSTAASAQTTYTLSDSGWLNDGEQACLVHSGYAASASASLKVGTAEGNGKLTIWDNTSGIRLGRVTGTSPFFIDTVFATSYPDDDELMSCVTNHSGVLASYQIQFVVTSNF